MAVTGVTVPASARRLARSALIACAITFAAAACPGIATAAPVWDIEEYDYCMRQTGGMPASDPVAQEEENDRYCCYRSGGVWNGITCAAPAADGEGGAVLLPGGPKFDLPTLPVRPPIVAPPPPPVLGPAGPMLPPIAG